MTATQMQTLLYLYSQNKHEVEMCSTTARDVAERFGVSRSSAKARLDSLVRAGLAFTAGRIGGGIAQHWGITKLGLKAVEKRPTVKFP